GLLVHDRFAVRQADGAGAATVHRRHGPARPVPAADRGHLLRQGPRAARRGADRCRAAPGPQGRDTSAPRVSAPSSGCRWSWLFGLVATEDAALQARSPAVGHPGVVEPEAEDDGGWVPPVGAVRPLRVIVAGAAEKAADQTGSVAVVLDQVL